MGRYLLYFSYIGTSFRGLQRQVTSGVPQVGVPTVQTTLESALKVLDPANEVQIVPSSRTDAGVHALSNTAHVDLQHRKPTTEFSPLLVTGAVNQKLFHEKSDIRLLLTRLVPDTFHARYCAVARHYVYRITVARNPAEILWAIPHSTFESSRSSIVVYPFDVKRLHEAAQVFVGTHDFRAFTNPRTIRDTHPNPVKTVSVGVRPGRMFLQPYQDVMTNNFDFWEIHVSSASFLYKQVRRMVGVMLQYALGQITLGDLRSTLDQPSDKICTFLHQRSAPPYGLYLKQVEYNDADLEYQLPADFTLDEDISILRVRRLKRSLRTSRVTKESQLTDKSEHSKSEHSKSEHSKSEDYLDSQAELCNTKHRSEDS